MHTYKFEHEIKAFERLDNIRDIRGHMSSHNQRLLMYHLGMVSTVAAEIGAYCGLSSVIVGLGMRGHGRYYSIDTFQCSNAELEKENTYQEYTDALKKYGLEETCIPVHGWSFHEETYRKIPDNLDFIYIDGDHHTESVILDGILYREKLRENGLMLFHDATWDSVNKGIRQLIELNLVEAIWREDDYILTRKTRARATASPEYLANLRHAVEKIILGEKESPLT
jgi:predicted O-methyltransferase YrrM